MALTVYATPSDLASWLQGSPPTTVVPLLRSATFVIAEACARNPYSDTPTGTDAAVLRDATCAQVAAWVALGINPDAVGIDGPAPVKKSSILGADIEYDTKAAVEARSQAARELAPQAESILDAAGLLWVPKPLADTSGALRHFGLSSPGPTFGGLERANQLDGFASDAWGIW